MITQPKFAWPFVVAALVAVIGSGYAVARNRVPRLTGTPNDSLVLADSAYRACGRLSGDARQSCYERMLVPLVRARGVRIAMGTLNRIGELDAVVKNDGHVYAHAIGIEAGKAGGDVSQAFASCTEIFQSGCYHGVIQAYFETVSNVNEQNVNALCQSYTTPDADRWLRFQCVHGMGHGLTMFNAHHLPEALQGCDLLRDDWDRESCYGGAFMENVVNATNPHHPAAQLHVGPRADTAAAASGHDHHGGGHCRRGSAVAARPPFKALDPNDRQYPCSIVATRYWYACYQMQTSVMLHFNNGDMGDASRNCELAPVSMRYVCHQSLGRDISAYSRQVHAEAIRMCSVANDEYEPWCHIGVVKNLIDLTARADDGIRYCEVLENRRNKLKCYEAVGEQIATLRNTSVERENLCAHTREEGRAACRFGAKVTTSRPDGLPAARTD